MRLFDFSMQNRPKKMNNTKENLLGALSQLYSKPVTEDDDTLDYIPTQYIAEFVKEKSTMVLSLEVHNIMMKIM